MTAVAASAGARTGVASPEGDDTGSLASAAPAEIRMRSLRIEFGDMRAVDDLDLDVPAGKITVLLGPSGCGKSTVLRAVSGLLQPSGGSITVDGEAVDGASADRAMVFQEDALLPWRTALANVELALALRGVRRRQREETALGLLRQVGLDGFEHALPRKLSGGMRQRVQLARTFALQPKVLLMDEPFGALDAQTRRSMQQLLVDVWHRYRTTVLFVTHDADEALLIADRIVVMSARPATVKLVVEIPSPRAPGSQFTPEFRRSRYEILAALGDDEGLDSDYVVDAGGGDHALQTGGEQARAGTSGSGDEPGARGRPGSETEVTA